MSVRYLYGDSEPFDGDSDFLSTLRAFVASASRCLLLQQEADELEKTLSEHAQAHLRGTEAIHRFFDGLVDIVADRASRSGAPEVTAPYANELIAEIESAEARAHARGSKDVDDNAMRVAAKVSEKRQEMAAELGRYLKAGALPVDAWALSIEVSGTAPSAHAVFTHPSEVLTSFALDIAADEGWSEPRRVSDFASGTSIQVGFKKAFLRSQPRPETVSLDDYTIGGLELGPDSGELRLKRKADQPRDSYVVSLDPAGDGGSVVRVSRFDDKAGSGEPFLSSGEDLEKIERLFTVLRGELEPVLERKTRMLWAQLDGQDILRQSLFVPFYSRIADRLATTAQEISLRSPNPNELSIKKEHPDGRREEVYLKKAELVSLVAPLLPDLRAMFYPLAFLPISDMVIGTGSSPGIVLPPERKPPPAVPPPVKLPRR